MAYRKTIEVDPLSKTSIKLAIEELKEEKERLEKLNHKFVDSLGDLFAERVRERLDAVDKNSLNVEPYNVTTRFVSEGDTEGILVEASGVNIAFIEFGAGAEANSGIYPYTKDPDSDAFTPGSWSKDNGRTYQRWENAGYPGLYYYEQPPARGFDTAISELREMIKQAADEVFG